MATTANARVTVALAGVVLLGARAWALVPAVQCESGQLRTAGRYTSCRSNDNASAAKSGTLDFSACDTKFSAKWGRAAKDGRGQCPSSSDQAAIQDFVSQCTDSVATALAGGPLLTCPGTQAGRASQPLSAG